MITYVQRTGNLYRADGSLVYNCYAGGNCGKNPEGVNNPDMQFVSKTGPLPCGFYTLEDPVNTEADHTKWSHPHLGAYAIPLEPDSDNEMGGRSGFFHHGDNGDHNQSASEGCIVHSPSADRMGLYNAGDHRLQVVAEETDR